MDDRIFPSLDEANTYASLLRKLLGKEFTVVQQGTMWTVSLEKRAWSIIDVTEQLLRQVGK